MSWEQRVEDKLDEILRELSNHGARLAVLEERTKAPAKKSGGGISISSGAAGGVVGAALSFIAQHWGGGK